jgi:hypothetical protein
MTFQAGPSLNRCVGRASQDTRPKKFQSRYPCHPTMKSVLAWSLFTAFAAEAAITTVNVLEFGKAGTVRRTQAKSPETSVEGVVSFWSALHEGGASQIQHAGMAVVPDLFRKPDTGVVVGIAGRDVDLYALESFSSLETIEESAGFMELPGNRCDALLKSVSEIEDVPVDALVQSAVMHGKKSGLSGVKTVVDGENAASLNKQISSMLVEFKTLAQETGQTIVVHVVFEQEASSSRRRRLEDNNQAEAADNVEDDQEQNGFYGQGYYVNGVYVTRYKTMFQIQYFNVVMWTAIGLVFAILYAIFLMIYMPLEPDTLLFGESAKLVGDD